MDISEPIGASRSSGGDNEVPAHSETNYTIVFFILMIIYIIRIHVKSSALQSPGVLSPLQRPGGILRLQVAVVFGVTHIRILGRNFKTKLLTCSVFSCFFHFSVRLCCIFLELNQKMDKDGR